MIQTIADNYQVPLSSAAAQKFAACYVDSRLSQTEADGQFKAYPRQTAAGLFPTLAPQINQGIDTKTLLDRYSQLEASMLGVDPDTINWSDPQWSKAVNGGLDPSTGRAVPMSLDQWGQTMRSDPTTAGRTPTRRSTPEHRWPTRLRRPSA